MRTALHALVGGAALLLAGAAVAQSSGDYRNTTAGGPLRAGVYGRIQVKGKAAPPPVIYPRPVLAGRDFVPPGVRPVYLYVPPGQVRKWNQNCRKWSACDEPVLFVRMDQSPSRWGKWRHRREQVALHQRD